MKKTIEGTKVTFTFADGVEPFTFDTEAMTPECKAHAIPFGMGHRLGDAAAIAKSADNGYIVTEAMRRAAIVELADYYAGGATAWNMRVAGKKEAPKNAAFIKLAEAWGCTYDEAMAKMAERALAEMMNGGTSL